MEQENPVKSQIRKLLSGPLPGKEAQRKMLPGGRELDFPESELEAAKQSSVLLLLYPENGGLFICLIKRPDTMKHHAGQVAFPGGRVDTGDSSAIEAALRETREEIGAGEIEILGGLTEIYLNISRFLIRPFVGWSERKPEFTINPQEVIRLILFPVGRFLKQNEPEVAVADSLSGKLEVPCYRFDGEIIWGATAMILAEFFEVVKPAFPAS